MPFITITSSENATLKQVAKLKQKKYRSRFKKYIIEGVRATGEVINAKEEAEFFVSRSFFEERADFTEILSAYKCYVLEDKLFAALSDTEAPQGILCTVGIKKPPREPVKPFYIYLDGVSDPGNVGTIIRTAHAFGFGGVMLSFTSSDAYSGKVIRSSMSSVLYTDIYTDFSHSELLALKNNGYKIVSTALKNTSVSLYGADISEKTVFVIGSEANGVSDEILAASDETLIIPMPGGAESLNASVAAALVMSEAVRRK